MGDTAPAFTLQTENGPISLSQFRGRTVVLYFYPKDDTPGCTVEACNFRDNLPEFSHMNATIIGVSKDSVSSHKQFKTKYSLNFTLGSDETGTCCETYGVMAMKNMYGKKYMGIERSTFVIDSTGTIRAIWRKVQVEGHATEVRKAVQQISKSSKKAA